MSEEKWNSVADELSRVLKTVSVAPRSSGLSRWIGLLNSSFVVTVLGGIALALLAQQWQTATMTRERTVANLHARQQAFYDCLTRFSLSTWILRDLTSRDLWIRYQRDLPGEPLLAPNGHYYDGIGLDDGSQVIERLRREYGDSGDLVAICEKLRGLCSNNATRRKLASLATLVRDARDVDGSVYTLPKDSDGKGEYRTKLKDQLKTANEKFREIEAAFSVVVIECAEEFGSER